MTAMHNIYIKYQIQTINIILDLSDRLFYQIIRSFGSHISQSTKYLGYLAGTTYFSNSFQCRQLIVNITSTDPQKAASVQAMLADIFCEDCGYF